MRTVDPSHWMKNVRGRKMALARTVRFGKRGGFEDRLRRSFRDATKELWGLFSVQGVRRIASEDSLRGERYRWIFLLTISLAVGTVTLSVTLADLVSKPPLLVNLQSAQHSINNLPFPAVALCSFNVISQRALNNISNQIIKLDRNRTYSDAAIRQNLKDSGALLTLARPKVDLQFAQYFANLALNGKFNVTELMLQLAPSCDSMLQRCSWAGKVKSCDKLFATRLTSVGVCCVFNGRYEDFDRDTPPKTLDRVGSDNGLFVAVKEDSDDFAYVRKPTIGTEVLIFDGYEYPVLEGGSVRVHIAQRNTSTFYSLSTSAQTTTSQIEYFNEAWRGCRLPSRKSHPLRWRRSYSWCLLECRRDVTFQLCGCVPYTLQPRDKPVCTLNELSCLNKHREYDMVEDAYHMLMECVRNESFRSQLKLSSNIFQGIGGCNGALAFPISEEARALFKLAKMEKFIYYDPTGYLDEYPDGGEALSEELQDALSCEQCRADCARAVFRIAASHATYFDGPDVLFRNSITYGLKLPNTSVIRLFYSSEDQDLYAVMSNSDWYEIIAMIGSQCVILLGISLVSVFEVIFHCTVRWRHHYVRRKILSKAATRRCLS